MRFAAGLLVPLQGCGRCRVHTTVQGQDCLHLRNFCCQNAVCAMKFGSWCGCRGGGCGISMAMWALGPGEDYVNAVAKTASAWLPPKNSFCLRTYPHIPTHTRIYIYIYIYNVNMALINPPTIKYANSRFAIINHPRNKVRQLFFPVFFRFFPLVFVFN